MTDDRPEPRYGQYAPIPPTPPAAPSDEPEPRAPYPRGDVVITTALLLIAVWDVVTGFAGFSTLGTVLAQVYRAQGIPGFTSVALADQVGAAMNIARIVILLAVIAVSLLLISRRRRAFWVPLAGGVLAGLLVIVCVSVVVLQDPALLAWAQTQSP